MERETFADVGIRIFGVDGRDDERLSCAVLRAQLERGDALDRLLRSVRPDLVAYFARRVRDETAEDLAQATLLRIVTSLDRIDPNRASRYIAVIARNVLRTALAARALDRRRFSGPVDPDELGTVVEAEELERRADWDRLLRAVHGVSEASMTPAMREVVVGLLRGCSMDEIAVEYGISPVTVRTRLMRARAVLRLELRHELQALTPPSHRDHVA
jgi:RNA polymerase sigma factor (sigma-70 family)